MLKLIPLILLLVACSTDSVTTTTPTIPTSSTTTTVGATTTTLAPSDDSVFSNGNRTRPVLGPGFSADVPVSWADGVTASGLAFTSPLSDEDDSFVEVVEVSFSAEDPATVADTFPNAELTAPTWEATFDTEAGTTYVRLIESTTGTFTLIYRGGDEFDQWRNDAFAIMDSFALDE